MINHHRLQVLLRTTSIWSPQHLHKRFVAASTTTARTTTTMATPASFVWVQVYYEDEEEPDGNAVEITPVPRNVYALTKAVKTEVELDAPVNKIYAYPPGTKPPFAKANSLRPGKALEEVIDELKHTTPPTSYKHPLIVVAPPPLRPPAKKQKIGYQFWGKFKHFAQYLNDSIDKVDDTILHEREDVESSILGWLGPIEGSAKPNLVTVWSGRGSGKTSLIRKITSSSDPYLEAARESGRLMIFDCSTDNIGKIAEELKSKPVAATKRFLVTLVGYHLCRVFKDTSVDGVDFTSEATFEQLWNRSESLPSSLVEKMDSIRSGRYAYEWWKSCTKGFLRDEEGLGPNPVIFIDNAETLAVVKDLPTENSTVATAINDSTDKLHLRTYLVLHWLVMFIPTNHALAAFGTGQAEDLPSPPLEFYSQANHMKLSL